MGQMNIIEFLLQNMNRLHILDEATTSTPNLFGLNGEEKNYYMYEWL
jgi:hypothetical protein